MAPWRVLVIDESEAESPAEPLGRTSAFSLSRVFPCILPYCIFSVVVLCLYPPNIAFSGAQVSIVPRISQRS